MDAWKGYRPFGVTVKASAKRAARRRPGDGLLAVS
jgi:hypothetical protein